MSKTRLLPLLVFCLMLPNIEAQVTEPSVFTVTEVNSMFGKPTTMVAYRNGSKAVVDLMNQPGEPVGTVPVSRTVYDLQKHTSISWDPKSKNASCSQGTWSGDWGDPFATSADILSAQAQGTAKITGSELVLGTKANIYEQISGTAKIKAWIDPKSGLLLRAQMTPSSGPVSTVIEVKQYGQTAPPPAVFALPASCSGANAAKPAPTEADRIAAETGDDAGNFVNAIYGPGSKATCTVALRVVKAGSMAPITRGFQVALDTKYDVDHPPHYDFGVRKDGSQSFAGGGIHEITDQVKDGIVQIQMPPAYFNLGVNLVKPGSGAGMGLIYRHCYSPTTVLLYVVNDPDQPSLGGDWLWVKSGKYSTIPPGR